MWLQVFQAQKTSLAQKVVCPRPRGLPSTLLPRRFNSSEINWQNEYIRLLAERDNERKAVDKRFKEERGAVGRSIVKTLLPFHDDLKRYTDFASTSSKEDFNSLESSFLSTLEKIGAKRIQTRAGDKYDPKFHEALAHEDGSGSQIVVARVVTTGFVMDDLVLR
eukprot:Protomagalhaensia_wolfi_Nauph_80__3968@NODE_401_length_2601_cov_41_259563_g19_i1_p3_GENE_NODE_401_length_2601_cov_41_259563_g19_i1NODE_401_length_2601_cov_41_259563_g19_i1_p3_ORF_typecomplete_len164_score28_42GrpE/PF01025_19/7_3e22DUF4482/PF14818_6/0_047_NODE_401_length_2601_cov_41_259563_g19_i173564